MFEIYWALVIDKRSLQNLQFEWCGWEYAIALYTFAIWKGSLYIEQLLVRGPIDNGNNA